jgi:hypothetical protein
MYSHNNWRDTFAAPDSATVHKQVPAGGTAGALRHLPSRMTGMLMLHHSVGVGAGGYRTRMLCCNSQALLLSTCTTAADTPVLLHVLLMQLYCFHVRSFVAPRTVQLYQMEQWSPTLTSPDTCAEGAIQLVLPTLGALRLAATTAGMRVTAENKARSVPAPPDTSSELTTADISTYSLPQRS